MYKERVGRKTEVTLYNGISFNSYLLFCSHLCLNIVSV
jgi:hypothetical protein